MNKKADDKSITAITSQQHDTITLYPALPRNYATFNDGYNSIAGESNGVIYCYDYHQDGEVVVFVALLIDMSLMIDCTSCPCIRHAVPNVVVKRQPCHETNHTLTCLSTIQFHIHGFPLPLLKRWAIRHRRP